MPRPTAMDGCDYIDLSSGWQEGDTAAILNTVAAWRQQKPNTGAARFAEDLQEQSASPTSHWPTAAHGERPVRIFHIQKPATEDLDAPPVWDVVSNASLVGVVLAALVAGASFHELAVGILAGSALLGAGSYVAKSRHQRA